MLTHLGEMRSAERETSQWREIRRTEQSIAEVREWFAFAQGAQFAGKPLPIMIHQQTVDQIVALLTANLVRLK
jgi:hypothetical protein